MIVVAKKRGLKPKSREDKVAEAKDILRNALIKVATNSGTGEDYCTVCSAPYCCGKINKRQKIFRIDISVAGLALPNMVRKKVRAPCCTQECVEELRTYLLGLKWAE